MVAAHQWKPEAMPAFELIRQFGVRVHMVEGLNEMAVYCPLPDPDDDLAFVRAGLDAEDLHWAAEQILAEALAERASLGT